MGPNLNPQNYFCSIEVIRDTLSSEVIHALNLNGTDDLSHHKNTIIQPPLQKKTPVILFILFRKIWEFTILMLCKNVGRINPPRPWGRNSVFGGHSIQIRKLLQQVISSA